MALARWRNRLRAEHVEQPAFAGRSPGAAESRRIERLTVPGMTEPRLPYPWIPGLLRAVSGRCGGVWPRACRREVIPDRLGVRLPDRQPPADLVGKGTESGDRRARWHAIESRDPCRVPAVLCRVAEAEPAHPFAHRNRRCPPSGGTAGPSYSTVGVRRSRLRREPSTRLTMDHLTGFSGAASYRPVSMLS